MGHASNTVFRQLADADLVSLVTAGDHDAMAEIFDRYYRMVMSVALRILGNLGDAEDVVQNVFIEFHQKTRLVDPNKGTLRTWLLQYAYGRSLNQKKKLKAMSRHEPIEMEEIEILCRPEGSRRVLDLDQPDAARLVEQILAQLNEKQRIVIQMAFFEGMKLSEVAEKTGESIGNVRHAYYRGIDKLRELLEEPMKPVVEQVAEVERTRSVEKLAVRWLRKPRKPRQPLTGEVDIA